MKHCYTLAVCLLCSLSALAADNGLIAKIKAKNASSNAVQCSFTQSKHIKMMANPIESKGDLYYESGKMTMLYSQPAGDYLVINSQQFVMQSRGKKLNHNVKEGSPMRTLRNTLLYCIQGDIDAIAQECNADIAYSQSGNLHVFTLTQKKKSPRGYSKIVLRFDTATLQLREMILEEANGNYTEYILGKQTAKTLNATIFQVPPRL